MRVRGEHGYIVPKARGSKVRADRWLTCSQMVIASIGEKRQSRGGSEASSDDEIAALRSQ